MFQQEVIDDPESEVTVTLQENGKKKFTIITGLLNDKNPFVLKQNQRSFIDDLSSHLGVKNIKVEKLPKSHDERVFIKGDVCDSVLDYFHSKNIDASMACQDADVTDPVINDKLLGNVSAPKIVIHVTQWKGRKKQTKVMNLIHGDEPYFEKKYWPGICSVLKKRTSSAVTAKKDSKLNEFVIHIQGAASGIVKDWLLENDIDEEFICVIDDMSV